MKRRALFGESSIGDTDGDGALEFVDGWGHPISFLPGHPGSNRQFSSMRISWEMAKPVAANSAWLTAAAGDHDPYDLFRIDQFAFRLVPLIFSAGRDETFRNS